jgi:threonine dehydrogenase-like Zn-dependent dehydrogenase
MSRHAPRQKLAREFGATEIVGDRGDEAAARIRDLTNSIGADSLLECVGHAAVDDTGDWVNPSRRVQAMSPCRTAVMLA